MRRAFRKIHKYLGIIIGIQLFLWTLSGVIFSWNSIDDVRGSTQARTQQALDLAQFKWLNIHDLLPLDSSGQTISKVQYRSLLDLPVIEITYPDKTRLYHGESGALLSPISEAQAKQIALADYIEDNAKVKIIELLTHDDDPHSEYRHKELPAYRVTLDTENELNIYVSANRGVVTSRRNDQWRLFDFFWMLHTMDFQNRDDFNSWLLKLMSVLALITIFSGYLLWWKGKSNGK